MHSYCDHRQVHHSHKPLQFRPSCLKGRRLNVLSNIFTAYILRSPCAVVSEIQGEDMSLRDSTRSKRRRSR